MSNGKKPAVIFGHNVARAEEDLGIQQDLGRRRFVPVAFRVGTNMNALGTNTATLKLLLWATRKGLGHRMTLDQFLPYYAEHWSDTGHGTREPSRSDHRNLHELWRLWKRNRHTLVSDVFELEGSAFAPKEALAAGVTTHEYTYTYPVSVEINLGYLAYRRGCHVKDRFQSALPADFHVFWEQKSNYKGKIIIDNKGIIFILEEPLAKGPIARTLPNQRSSQSATY